MSSSLSSIPVDRRKQAAATLGLFAVLFVAVGAVAATGPGTAIVRAFVVVALVVAVLLALMAWGVVHSVRASAADASLDAAIEEVVAASPKGFGQLCDCGHEHDPTELHITDAEFTADSAADVHAHTDACAHDGTGDACGHDCTSCVLASLRPSPDRTRAERLTH